jgi:hypothetical protein
MASCWHKPSRHRAAHAQLLRRALAYRRHTGCPVWQYGQRAVRMLPPGSSLWLAAYTVGSL